MRLHGTLLEGVLWPIEVMGSNGKLLKEVPWPMAWDPMGHC